MKNKLKKIYKKIIRLSIRDIVALLFLFFSFSGLLVWAINTKATGWRVNDNTTATIDLTSYGYSPACKTVQNNNCAGYGVFVPTKTKSEWTNFINNKPSCVALGECAPGSCILPWGGSIANGQSVTAYLNSDVFGGLCLSQIRTCNNGVLSGTYTNIDCRLYGLYFVANNGINGSELWKSDGTTAGTVMVKDINAGGYLGQYSSAPDKFIDINGTLYFTADNGINGVELWKSDGTTAGTVMVKDINAGGYGGEYSSAPDKFIDINGTLYFVADNGINGRELWKSDGTTAGTVMVKDINAGGYLGEYSSAPDKFIRSIILFD